MGLSSVLGRLARASKRAAALLAHGDARLQNAQAEAHRSAKLGAETVKISQHVRADLEAIDRRIAAVRDEVKELRRETRDRLLQYNHQLGRLARGAVAQGDAAPAAPRLSGRSMPVAVDDVAEPDWTVIGGGVAPPDPEGREWATLAACPACEGRSHTLISPWNKLIVLAKAPDTSSAHYDYSLCQDCGVLFAARRPTGARYRFLLEHFGEVTAKRGGTAEITNRVLNPYPLTDADRAELRRLAAPGVYVSDHLGLTSKEYLAPLMRERFENSVHGDILGTFLEPRGARVLEVRSRTGTILDGLRRAWGAEVYAMPIWESQQLLLREVFHIETSDLIDFERFRIPFDGVFDLIICNHMFTHVLQPRAFFAELRRALKPGGYIYLYNEPDDQEYLAGNQSMFATLNPLHLQAFDQASLLRALAANGFETVFTKRRDLSHLALARQATPAPAMTPMDDRERRRRLESYQRAFDRAVLGMDEHLRPRVATTWPAVVERAIALGTAEYDERGQLRLVAR